VAIWREPHASSGFRVGSRAAGTEGLDLIAAGLRRAKPSAPERADVIQAGEGFTVRVLDEMTATRPISAAAVPAATVAVPGPVFAPGQSLAGLKALS
jgi:hypothetical protein